MADFAERMIGLLLLFCIVYALVFLVSCGGPNQAYLQDNWPRFQQECVVYCAPLEAHPSRAQRPWVCGCEDFLDEDWTPPQ